jgi:hypothetical protein
MNARPGKQRTVARPSLLFMFGLVGTVLTGLVGACQVNTATAEGKAELFTIEAAFRPLTEAGDGDSAASLVASLKITVAKGYKWNAEYPFRLTIKEQTKTRLSKERFSASDLRVAADQASAQIDLGATGTRDPDASIRGTVSFSVCDKSVCKVYRNREVQWSPAKVTKETP